jgi:hypothetical protein
VFKSGDTVATGLSPISNEASSPRRLKVVGALLAGVVTLTGCSVGHDIDSFHQSTATTTAAKPQRTPPSIESETTIEATTVPTIPTTEQPTTTTQTTVESTTTTVIAPFSASVEPVTEAELGATWHPGCPVAPDQLSQITMSYFGFDGKSHTGNMVVNTSVTKSIIDVFSTLYTDQFPIEEMVPEAAYGGNDNTAAAADDTSGFNCRDAVATGPPKWSVHAYGEAIDVNDVQNPYIFGSQVIPPAGEAYANRSDIRPGMALPNGVLVGAFAAAGWQWGGRWTGSPDYQHFSLTGQ